MNIINDFLYFILADEGQPSTHKMTKIKQIKISRNKKKKIIEERWGRCEPSSSQKHAFYSNFGHIGGQLKLATWRTFDC
jgi:hypothetical protein